MLNYIKVGGDIYSMDMLYEQNELHGSPYCVKKDTWVIYKESIDDTSDNLPDLFDYLFVKNKAKTEWVVLGKTRLKDFLNDDWDVYGMTLYYRDNKPYLNTVAHYENGDWRLL